MPRINLFAILLLNLIGAPMLAAAPRADYGSVRVDEVSSIYDGDTIRVSIHAWPAVAGERIPVRLYGIDTPEMSDKRPRVYKLARSAKQFSVAQLRGAKRIELRQMRRDKYFRLLAEVWVDGRNLSELLLKAGLAKPYFGGKKVSW
jgi:micrococcal nuclease